MKLISLAKTPLEFKLEVLDLLRSYAQSEDTGSPERAILNRVIVRIAGIAFRDPSTEPGLGMQIPEARDCQFSYRCTYPNCTCSKEVS